MSTPSEKHSIKDTLSYFADNVEDFRRSGNHHAEAEAWKALGTFVKGMEESATECAESLDRLKEVMLRVKFV